MNRLTEDTLVQQTAAAYLEHVHGWQSVHAHYGEVFGAEAYHASQAKALGRDSEREVVLTHRLRAAVERLNPGRPAEVYDDAVRAVTEASTAQTTLQINRAKHAMLLDGVEVVYRDADGAQVKERLRLLHFRDPLANDFLAVRELWVKGPVYRRRADLVGFVNGLPLVFMEFKRTDHDIRKAYEDNLADYKDTVPHLFHHNALVVLANGIDAKLGAFSSPYRFFREWKRQTEDEAGRVDMETLLEGVCAKKALLEIVEHFIVFDDSNGDTAKILAQNQQVLGVRRAVEAVRNRERLDGKLGVFWHTQGSGKSYSMVFFVRMVHRLLGNNYTFVVVTDRQDLDTQIYQTFNGCGLADNDRDPCRPESGQALEAMLRTHKRVVFTLVQKFNQEVEEPYSERDDAIVISDEAHRTQYGMLAENMRAALPRASYIGFTGTPLFKDDELTRRIFGAYVSTYDFQRAVEDNATVPLYYDARGEKLGLATTDLNEKVAAALEAAEIEDDDVARRLERELSRDYHVLTAETRLDAIARDFVQHYAKGWETGKALFVCLDKVTCVRMYDLIQQHWAEHIARLEKAHRRIEDDQEAQHATRQLAWMRETEMAVVVSEHQGEVADFRKWGLDIVPHRQLMKEGFEVKKTDEAGHERTERLDVETAFKRDDHPFRVAIVCAMWLTGFDVPSLSTLYLDKPLRAHTLMQAIARANRVYAGKNNGLIVDYCGILRNLRQALATYAGHEDDGRGGSPGDPPPPVDPVRPDEELLEDLAEAVGLARAFLEAHGTDLDAITTQAGFARLGALRDVKEAVNADDRTRKQFEIIARAVFTKYKACFGIDAAKAYRADRDALDLVYKSLQEDVQKADISDIMRTLQAVVDEAITVEDDRIGEGTDTAKLYDTSRIDFDRLRKEFEQRGDKNTTVQNLKAAIAKRLDRMMQQNPLRTDFQARYEEIIEAYNREKDRATIEQTFEELLRFVGDLDQEEERAVREGLTEESLALFDLLAKPDLSKKERTRLKEVAESLLAEIKQELATLDDWRAKEATRHTVETKIYDFLYDDHTGLPVEHYEVDEVRTYATRVYHHIFRAYPSAESPYFRQAA
ncbi:MAG: type I restriction endonuclease subunit R [Bacteroidota bacterium]